MTNSTPASGYREDGPDDAACRREAVRIRQERPRWVVIWVSHKKLFRAYPKFRAPRGTVASAARPEELVAQMEKAELAARRPPGRPPNTAPS